MQAWGTTSRFEQRDTAKEPTKSGALGVLAAAIGIDRADWAQLEPLTRLSMGVRHDRPGVLSRDFQTAGQGRDNKGRGRMVRANAKEWAADGVVSNRSYLADAAFLVGLEGSDRQLLACAHESLRDPVWLLGLGRKSYVPAEPVYVPDGLRERTLREALLEYPYIGRGGLPEKLLFSFETTDGTGRMVMDQPLSCFAERRFGSRFVHSEWLTLAKEEEDVSA